MKNIKLGLVFALLLISASPYVFAESTVKPTILHPNGLLWKIEKSDAPDSYLFGTMHVSDSRVTTLSSEVDQAFMNARHFVMEVLMNAQVIRYMGRVMFFSDGRTLHSVLGEAEYNRLITRISARVSMSQKTINRMKPWALLMMLMLPAEQQLQSAPALDMVLYSRASQRGMQLSGLESIQEQVSIFESMSMSDQLWLLNRSIEEMDTADQQWPAMLNAYLERDLAKLVKIQQDFMYEDSLIDDRFMVQLLDVRNVRMVERMQGILKQGQAFIAIGALHLPGEKGVLHLLEQQGYKVTVIY